jgi:hypothetical protein
MRIFSVDICAIRRHVRFALRRCGAYFLTDAFRAQSAAGRSRGFRYNDRRKLATHAKKGRFAIGEGPRSLNHQSPRARRIFALPSRAGIVAAPVAAGSAICRADAGAIQDPALRMRARIRNQTRRS